MMNMDSSPMSLFLISRIWNLIIYDIRVKFHIDQL